MIAIPKVNANLRRMRSLSLAVHSPRCELGLEDGLDLVDRFHPWLHNLPVLPSFLRVPAQLLHISQQFLLMESVDHSPHVILELLQQGASLLLIIADDAAHLFDGLAEHLLEIWDFWLVFKVGFEVLVRLSDSALLHFSIQL